LFVVGVEFSCIVVCAGGSDLIDTCFTSINFLTCFRCQKGVFSGFLWVLDGWALVVIPDTDADAIVARGDRTDPNSAHLTEDVGGGDAVQEGLDGVVLVTDRLEEPTEEILVFEVRDVVEVRVTHPEGRERIRIILVEVLCSLEDRRDGLVVLTLESVDLVHAVRENGSGSRRAAGTGGRHYTLSSFEEYKCVCGVLWDVWDVW
jgi:hypothetical protein